MKELRSEVDIEASAARVWRILTDFDAYPRWNPFMRKICGKPEPGTRLVVRLQPSGTRGVTFRPVVLEVEPNRELRWLGRLLISGLFDGEHIFTIQPLGKNKVLFIQREVFRGVLVPLLARRLDRNTRRGFIEMNYALKLMAEQDMREQKYG